MSGTKRKLDEGQDLTKKKITKETNPIAQANCQIEDNTPKISTNIPAENSLVPMYPEDTNTIENTEVVIPVSNQQNIVNTLRQAPNLFQNATFTNCNITF